MYVNDSLKFVINGRFSNELWLTQGVKQGEDKIRNITNNHGPFIGCNLSPLLFSLFISQLGPELNSSGLGIDLGDLNVSSLFFADDIVLIAKNKKSLDILMSKTRNFFKSHRLTISETKSKIMTHDSFSGKTSFNDSANYQPITLDNVVAFKYLGIHVSSSPYSLFKDYNTNVKTKAQRYLTSVLSISKTGPDRSEMAYMTWSRIALPSILYGSEVMPLTQDTINIIEKYQSQIAKFMLQIPRSSASVSTHLDAGFPPVWSIIAQKVMLYASSTMRKPDTNWAKIALKEQVSQGYKCPYSRYLLKWKAATNCFGVTPKQIQTSVTNAATTWVLSEQKQTCVTTFAMNGPDQYKNWFKPKGWVNDSSTSRLIARFRACNTQLGNRGPARNGQYYKLCPLCSKAGIAALNNEV